MQLVRWLCVAENDYKRSVEELGAVDFDLVGEGVARELRDVALQVQNVQAFSQSNNRG